MDDPVVGFSLKHREDLVLKLCGDFGHGDCHCFNVKDSDFVPLGENIY